jgi:hypothetical protein
MQRHRYLPTWCRCRGDGAGELDDADARIRAQKKIDPRTDANRGFDGVVRAAIVDLDPEHLDPVESFSRLFAIRRRERTTERIVGSGIKVRKTLETFDWASPDVLAELHAGLAEARGGDCPSTVVCALALTVCLAPPKAL